MITHHQDMTSRSSPFRAQPPPPPSPYVFPGPIVPSSSISPSLHRNQSVSDSLPHPSPSGGLRRSRSFTSSDPDFPPAAASAASRPHFRFFMDDAIHELLGHHRKHHSRRPPHTTKHPAGAFSVLSSFFSCLNPCRKPSSPAPEHDGGGDFSASLRIRELLEISRKQQSELANKQDTIDMLEWQLEQLQAAAAADDLLSDHFRGSGGDEAAHVVLHEVSCSADLSNSVVDQGSDEDDDDGNCSCEEAVAKNGTIDHSRLLPPKQEDRENKAIGGGPKDPRRSAEIACPAGGGGGGGLHLFEMAADRARYSIRWFCKAMIKQMEASGLPVLAALAGLEPAAAFARKQHAVYALEARISRVFFHCFENDSFDETGITQILDPTARCEARWREFERMRATKAAEAIEAAAQEAYDAGFRRFCQRKTREMWGQLPWSVEFGSEEEKGAFTTAFLEAAKSVWLQHKLAFSMHPSVAVLRVGSGMPIDPLYVDAVTAAAGAAAEFPAKLVAFLVMPGFQTTEQVVVKCQVYPLLGRHFCGGAATCP